VVLPTHHLRHTRNKALDGKQVVDRKVVPKGNDISSSVTLAMKRSRGSLTIDKCLRTETTFMKLTWEPMLGMNCVKSEERSLVALSCMRP
jgi:hypothetical protein